MSRSALRLLSAPNSLRLSEEAAIKEDVRIVLVLRAAVVEGYGQEGVVGFHPTGHPLSDPGTSWLAGRTGRKRNAVSHPDARTGKLNMAIPKTWRPATKQGARNVSRPMWHDGIG